MQFSGKNFRKYRNLPQPDIIDIITEMVKLSDLIGEEKVNRALKSFLQHNQYPKKPSSLDLIDEFYKIAPNESSKKQIDALFKAI